MSANFDRVATFMRELADTIARGVKSRVSELSEGRAVEIGFEIAREACEEYGGQLLYVPKGHALQITERDRSLYEFYMANGRDIVATAKKFEVSMQTAYLRIRLVVAADIAERQGTLFSGQV
jgi:Mor family transcriptional regulator